MATMQTTQGTQGSYPIEDLAYDVLTVLHQKSKGLEAYDKYLQDAKGDQVEDVLRRIRQQDEQCIAELKQHMVRLLGRDPNQPIAAGQSATQGQQVPTQRR